MHGADLKFAPRSELKNFRQDFKNFMPRARASDIKFC